jgi:cytochrome c-type biogenesis protein
MSDMSLPVVLLAGLLSFLSPCVLPLVPPYLSYITGLTLDELTHEGEQAAKRDARLAAVVFVLGFSTVFILLGASASALGNVLRQNAAVLSMVAGGAIMLMGFHFLGLFRLGFLYRTARAEVGPGMGLWGAYAMGLAFAFGWTPCIGPVLGSVLAVAGSKESVAQGAMLLGIYSLGLGLPFIVAAFAMGPFLRFMRRFRQHLGLVEKAMGVLLVLTGLAFLTGSFASISYWLLETFPALGKLG